MSMSDELGKLAELHQRGVLSDTEFAQAKARVLASTRASAPGMAAVNALRRSRSDRWLGGVCAGIGEITGVATWIWRLVLASLVLCGGTGLFLYLLLWVLVPQETRPFDGTTAQPQA